MLGDHGGVEGMAQGNPGARVEGSSRVTSDDWNPPLAGEDPAKWTRRRGERYLVTGGAGFIGSRLTERLLERGDEVVVLDDLSTGSLSNLLHLQDHPRLK